MADVVKGSGFRIERPGQRTREEGWEPPRDGVPVPLGDLVAAIAGRLPVPSTPRVCANRQTGPIRNVQDDPLVRAVLSRFPGSRIVAVRSRS